MPSLSSGLPKSGSKLDGMEIVPALGSAISRLTLLAGIFRLFVRSFIHVIGKSLLLFGIQFPGKLFALSSKFHCTFYDGLVLGHVSLLHGLIGSFKVPDISIITLKIVIGRLAAQRWPTI